MRSTAIPLSAKVIFGVIGVVWLAIELRKGLHKRAEASTADQGSKLANIIPNIGVVVAIALALIFPSAIFGSRHVTSWLGICVFVAGFALRLWCFAALGQYFTFMVQTSKDQPVIQSGPYKFLRHPSYAGVLLVVTGVGIFFGYYISLLVAVGAVFAGLAYRIGVEEAALENELGTKYSEFAKGRKRLIPFVW